MSGLSYFQELEKSRICSEIYISSDYKVSTPVSKYNIYQVLPLYTLDEINPKKYEHILMYKSKRSKCFNSIIMKLNNYNYNYEINKINNKYLLFF